MTNANRQQELADEYQAQRGADLHDFFNEVDNVNSDPSWLREREHELQITPGEWQAYQAHREREGEAAQGAF